MGDAVAANGGDGGGAAVPKVTTAQVEELLSEAFPQAANLVRWPYPLSRWDLRLYVSFDTGAIVAPTVAPCSPLLAPASPGGGGAATGREEGRVPAPAHPLVIRAGCGHGSRPPVVGACLA